MALFFEIGIGAYLDGRIRIQWLISLLIFAFLPALIELKIPKDGGPKRIIAGVSEVNLQVAPVLPIVNIEDEQKFDSSLVQTMGKAISFLPSLEI